MSHFTGYRCSICKQEYLPGQVTYTCPKDGGNLDVVLDYESIRSKYQPEDMVSRRDFSLWRYLPLLPVPEYPGDATPLHSVGWTPVFNLSRAGEKLGLKQLWLKDESGNPTASFKDRASAVVVARAREIKAEVVVTASTGNAGAALAGMAAAVGQKAVILAPKTAPAAKVAQLLIFGATVILVDGSYDDAFDLTVKAADEFNWYCRNTGYNPFTAEGKKTAAFEIWEWWRGAHLAWHKQIGEGADHAPLTVFIPVGDGNIISGIHKGFKELLQLGWLTVRRVSLESRRKVPPRLPMHFMQTRKKSHPCQRKPLRIASQWTCLAMASVRCALCARRVGHTSRFPIGKFCRRLQNWASSVFLPNLPERPPTPVWFEQRRTAW
jgi:threonine synthase